MILYALSRLWTASVFSVWPILVGLLLSVLLYGCDTYRPSRTQIEREKVWCTSHGLSASAVKDKDGRVKFIQCEPHKVKSCSR